MSTITIFRTVRTCPQDSCDYRAKRRYHKDWTPEQAVQTRDLEHLVNQISLDVLDHIAQWLRQVPKEKRVLAQRDAVDPKRESVFPATHETHQRLVDHIEQLPVNVADWFDHEALVQMKPKAQNAWFYSYNKLYSKVFQEWVERAETLLLASEARVFYSTPVEQSSDSVHRKRGRTVQAITLTMPKGRVDGILETPKQPDKCVKCNGSKRSLYFQVCGCRRHYADRCLRCKIVQWALEGAFGQRLRGRALMPDPLTQKIEFHGKGRCLEGCGQEFELSQLTQVVHRE